MKPQTLKMPYQTILRRAVLFFFAITLAGCKKPEPPERPASETGNADPLAEKLHTSCLLAYSGYTTMKRDKEVSCLIAQMDEKSSRANPNRAPLGPSPASSRQDCKFYTTAYAAALPQFEELGNSKSCLDKDYWAFSSFEENSDSNVTDVVDGGFRERTIGLFASYSICNRIEALAREQRRTTRKCTRFRLNPPRSHRNPGK